MEQIYYSDVLFMLKASLSEGPLMDITLLTVLSKQIWVIYTRENYPNSFFPPSAI